MSGFNDPDKLATAKMADPYTLGEKYPFEEGMFFWGRHPGNYDQLLGAPIQSHIYLNAETQEDKGRALVIPNIILWPGSVFVTSPKADTMEITAASRGPGDEFCAGRGQKLVCLDPMKTARINPRFRAYFNQVPSIDPNNPMRMASRIVDAYSIQSSERDPFWEHAAQELAAVGLADLRTNADYGPQDWNLPTLYEKLLAGNVDDSLALAQKCAAGDQAALDICAHGVPDGVTLWLERMAQNPAEDGYIARYARNLLAQTSRNPRYIEGIRGTALHHLRFCLLKDLRDNLTGRGFDPSQAYDPAELKSLPGGVSAYVTLPSADRELATGWEKMVTKLSMDACKDNPKKSVTGHKVLFSLDEFLGYGRMKDVERGATEYASADIALFLSGQKFSVLRDTYKEAWETFVGAASTFITYGMREHFTLKYLSDLLGQMEVVKIAHGTNRARTRQIAHNEQYTETTGSSTGTVTTIADTRGTGTSISLTHGHGSSDGGGSGSSTSPGRMIELYKGQNWNRNWSRNSNSSKSHSRQENQSRTTSTAQQESTQKTSAYAYGTTHTDGTSEGETTQQTFHKRPLLEVNELRVEFASCPRDMSDWRFPGLMLVLDKSSDPFPVRKCYYDSDPLFEGRFTPDRNHDFIPMSEQPMLEHMFTDDHLFDFCLPADLKEKRYRLYPAPGVRRGQVVNPGQPLAVLIGPRDHEAVSYSNLDKRSPEVFDSTRMRFFSADQYGHIETIRAPFPTRVLEVGSADNVHDDFAMLVRREERPALPAPAFDRVNEQLIDLADAHTEWIEESAQAAHDRARWEREEEARRRHEAQFWPTVFRVSVKGCRLAMRTARSAALQLRDRVADL